MVLLEQINKESFQVEETRFLFSCLLKSIPVFSCLIFQLYIFVFIWFVERLSQLMHFSHSAEQLTIISKSFLTESQSNFRSIFENRILMSDVLPPRWSRPGPCGGWGCRGKQASVWHLGEHCQCGQQDGEHWGDGEDTGYNFTIDMFYENIF